MVRYDFPGLTCELKNNVAGRWMIFLHVHALRERVWTINLQLRGCSILGLTTLEHQDPPIQPVVNDTTHAPGSLRILKVFVLILR